MLKNVDCFFTRAEKREVLFRLLFGDEEIEILLDFRRFVVDEKIEILRFCRKRVSRRARSYSATPGKTTSAATEASATGGGAPQTFGKHPSVSSKRPSAVHLRPQLRCGAAVQFSILSCSQDMYCSWASDRVWSVL